MHAVDFYHLKKTKKKNLDFSLLGKTCFTYSSTWKKSQIQENINSDNVNHAAAQTTKNANLKKKRMIYHFKYYV